MVAGDKKIEDYRNTFANLALPLFAMCEPIAPKAFKHEDLKWSLWDRWTLEGDLTVQVRPPPSPFHNMSARILFKSMKTLCGACGSSGLHDAGVAVRLNRQIASLGQTGSLPLPHSPLSLPCKR